MSGEFKEFFEELFFGSGSWLGLIIIIAIIVLVTAKEKFSGVIFLPITVLLSIHYFQNVSASNDFMWSGVLMLIVTIYCLVMVSWGVKERA